MTSYVIHKASRLPSVQSYDGPTWERANLREKYRPTYTDFWKARSLAYHLTLANPGVAFNVSEVPNEV